MTTNETIARWLVGWEGAGYPEDLVCEVPQYDREDWHWRGDDGVLAEIERRGRLAGVGGLLFALNDQYRAALPRECGLTGPVAAVGWEKFLLKATPAQLAAALVKVIEGEPDSALGARGGLEI